MRLPAPFVLNCSRVGLHGGLKTFSDELMGAIVEDGFQCRAILPAGYTVPQGVDAVFTPDSLAGAANLSLLRPLRWLAYSSLNFPCSKDQKLLSTTHQVVPGHPRQIVTVHDLRPYFLPDTPVQRFYFHHMLGRALARCDGVLTVSESSRQTIAEVYKLSLDRIAVVPNAIRPPALPLTKGTANVEPYLLAVGASWAHKNIEALLDQHDLWSARYRIKIVAGVGPYRAHLEGLALSLGIAAQLDFLSGITPEQLDELYAGCSALVYPSRMEGFGLPPLEAMARMRPVIVADLPVFRELYGRHALYVQPQNADSWQNAFVALQSLAPDCLLAARDHALAYNRKRMALALRSALHQFWTL